MDLRDRFSSLETKRERINTALGQIIVILEGNQASRYSGRNRSRRRRSSLGKVETRLDRVEIEIKGLRRDMPSIVADAMREVLKEQKS